MVDVQRGADLSDEVDTLKKTRPKGIGPRGGGMAQKKQPNPVDIAVGSRVRMRRVMLGMTQEQLGDKLGITFQQVQKYEKGMNRIGASRLQQIAQILDVPVSFFFEQTTSVPMPGALRGGASGLSEESGSGYYDADAPSGDGLALAKAFSRIKDPRVRRRVIDLVETLADMQRF